MVKGGSGISCSWVNECISDLRIALSMTAHTHCCYTGRRDSPVPYIFLLLSSIRSKRPFLAHHYHGSDILARPPIFFTCPDVPSQELISSYLLTLISNHLTHQLHSSRTQSPVFHQPRLHNRCHQFSRPSRPAQHSTPSPLRRPPPTRQQYIRKH